MSINFSQNPQYYNQQDNFGAVPENLKPENTMAASMLKSMELPTNTKELKEFAPYMGAAVGFSYFVSKLANIITRAKLNDNPNATVADTFNQSKLNKWTQSIDNKTLPIINKYSKQITGTKNFFQKYTPNWVKNAWEKIQIGVAPKCSMAKNTYLGQTNQSIDFFFECASKIDDAELTKLGIKDLIARAGSADHKLKAELIEEVSKKLGKFKASDIKTVKVPRKGLFRFLPKENVNIINELNKSRGFIGKNAKTTLTKIFQKGTLGSIENAGGAVIGGLGGMIMNSIFVATALKRTWDAPKEDKFSTFMEAIFVDFIGGYFMMLFGTKLTYKLLGLKNIDKTPAQIKAIKEATEQIVQDKQMYKALSNLSKNINPNMQITKEFTDELDVLAKTLNIDDADKLLNADFVKNLAKSKGEAINAAIDNLAQMRAFQKVPKGGFFRNLFNRPIRAIGNFFSVGLESLPTKVAVGNVSKFKAGWQTFKNGFKHLAGYPLRFVLILAVVTPPLTKLMTKITHGIFGRPKHSVYLPDEPEKTDTTKKAQEQKINMDMFSQYTKATGAIRAAQEQQLGSQIIKKEVPSAPIVHDYVNRIKNKGNANTATMPTIANNSSSSNSKTNNSPATYIPSTVPTQFVNTEIANALGHKLSASERAEKYALRELEALKNPQNLYN